MPPKKRTRSPTYYDKASTKSIESIHALEVNIKGLKSELKRTLPPPSPKHAGSWGLYYRGQPNFDEGLLPSVGRTYCYAGKRLFGFSEEQERNLLHRFRRASYSHFGRVPDSWEALILARHYGLPTRLLDWTRNPYVGLYFACVFGDKPKPETDGAFWILVRKSTEEYDINVLSKDFALKDYQYARQFRFGIRGVKLVYPPRITERITAQDGLFTVQEDPCLPLENHRPEDYLSKDFDILMIRKWKVPMDWKAPLLEQLESHGVKPTSLFPDIEGFATGLWKTEVMRSGTKFRGLCNGS